jgi:hypothetical protein
MNIQNRKTINNFLGNSGFATLDDPQGLIPQLAFFVEDDEHFKQLLNRCTPELRRDMYEALRPHLSFSPRPLDVYISELGLEAEIQQLPTLDEQGRFVAFRVQDIRTREEESLRSLIGGMVEEAIAQHHLVLTCRSCTREEVFHGGRRADAIMKARQAGWTYGLDRNAGADRAYELCPDCPGSKN